MDQIIDLLHIPRSEYLDSLDFDPKDDDDDAIRFEPCGAYLSYWRYELLEPTVHWLEHELGWFNYYGRY